MDGRVETCGGNIEVLEQTNEYGLSAGMPTYVIGIDTKDNLDDPLLPEALDRLAAAGGTSKYVPAMSTAQLISALSAILLEISSCESL